MTLAPLLLSSAHAALIDNKGRIVSVNDAWRNFRGASVVQGLGHDIGLNYLELCDAATGDKASEAHRVAAGVRAVLDGSAISFSLEYPFPTAALERWFVLTVTHMANGHPSGALITRVDITGERQSVLDLRSSELRFRQMAENINDVFFLQNPDATEIYYVSPAYERIWGRSCESLYAKPGSWIDSFHPADIPLAAAQLESGSPSFEYEFRIIRPDGEQRWIHVRGFAILDDSGMPYRTAGVATDITDRKQALEALRESERRFSGLLGNVQLAAVMLDRDACITYCNEYLLHLAGWRIEEVVGRNWFEAFMPPELGDMRPVFQALLQDLPEAWHRDNEIFTRSGERRMLRWSNSVLRSALNEVIGVASIGEDITDRMKADEVLAKRATELERFHRLSVGRELEMIALKKQVNELAKKAGQEPPYDLKFVTDAPTTPKRDHDPTP